MSHTAVPFPAMETCHQAPPAAPGAFSVVDVFAPNFPILAPFKNKKKPHLLLMLLTCRKRPYRKFLGFLRVCEDQV